MVDDVDALIALVRSGGSFPPLQRGLYRNAAELAAMGNNAAVGEGEEAQAPPARCSFRKFFARSGEPLVPGVDSLLGSERFIEAAKRLHDGIEVRPVEVYVNVSVPENGSRAAHTDVPDFRGIARRQVSTGVLTTMRRSGLFDRWHIPIAAMVGWVYDGAGGAYTYWPDGPSEPARQTAQPFSNTGIVGENDTMFHRGEPIVGPDGGQPGVPGMTVDADLWPIDGGGWRVVEGGRALAEFSADTVRLCVSWTAEVVRDADERRLIDEHLDDLDVETIISVFSDDLRARGTPVTEGADLLEDPRGLALLARAYSIEPLEAIA
jgi:hypothetical protein